MAGVIANPCEAVNQLGHARKRPELGGIAERKRTLEQRLLEHVELIARQPGLSSCAPGRTQSLPAFFLPRLSPTHRARAADLQPPRDRRLRLALLEQPDRAHPASLERFEVASCHAPLPPRRERSTVTILCEYL